MNAVPTEARDASDLPGARVTGFCELLSVGVGNLGLLQEAVGTNTVLATQLFLQLLCFHLGFSHRLTILLTNSHPTLNTCP